MRVAETRLDKLKKQIAALDSVAVPLITAINDRGFWPEILEDLNAHLPEADIWITELAATSGGNCWELVRNAPRKLRPPPRR
jgi:Tfp pilus assembly protein PilN